MTSAYQNPLLGAASRFVRKWRYGLLLFVFLEVIGGAIVSNLPKTYRARAELYFGDDAVPEHLFDMSWQGYGEERVKSLFIKETSYDALVDKVRLFDVVKEMPKHLREDYVGRISKDIEAGKFLTFIEQKIGETAFEVPIMVTIGFYVGVDSTDPVLAAKGANAISEAILKQNDLLRKQSLEDAVSFFSGRKESIQEELKRIEVLLGNLDSKGEDQVRQNRYRLRALREKAENASMERDVVIRLMAKTEDLLSGYANVGKGSGAGELKRLLNLARAELAALSRIYNSDHPDISIAEGNIAYLEVQLAEMGVNPRLDVAENDPYFFKLSNQLSTLKAKSVQLKQVIDGLTKEIAAVESYFQSNTHRDSGGYNDLVREYEFLQSELAKIKQSEYVANMAASLSELDKVGLLVLESPANEPQVSIYPNVFSYMILVTYVSWLASMLFVGWRSKERATLFNSDDIELCVGVRPVGIIPRY